MIIRSEFLGYDFVASGTIQDVAQEIFAYQYNISELAIPFVFTPNLDYLVNLEKQENKIYKSFLQSSYFILPDGQPIIWASKLFNVSIKNRLAGSDLFAELYPIIKHNNAKTLFLTTSSSVTRYFLQNYENAFCYTLPLIDLENLEQVDKIVLDCTSLISENKIKFVFIGVSFPKQDVLGMKIFSKLIEDRYELIPIFLLIGASLEFQSGLKRRAPLFWQRLGMEWFFRFLQEPKRLFKRYFLDSWKFLTILINYKRNIKNI